MKSKYLKPFIKNLASFKTVQALGRLGVDGYLFNNGWFESFKLGKPVSADHQAIPWLTYPFIDFISPRLTNEHTLLEFGAGNSTLFFAKKVKATYSVENHEEWYNTIKDSMPANSTLYFEKDVKGGAYAKSIAKVGSPLDIILVDGRDRVNCSKTSLEYLSEDGVLILDNSDRAEYQEAFDFYKANGFKKLDFWGMAPGFIDRSCTTVFYRTNNCLGI